ncbi:MAG: hypothetical protein LE169_01620 [Endomicrobium sp.]|nr:hypothetical protein [Endomicrobium sp.]
MPSLTSNTSNASASVPSNTPAPTPEPSKTAQPLSGTADTGSSVVKIVLCVAAFIALIVVTALGIRRYFVPEVENIYIAPLGNRLENVNRSTDDLIKDGYKPCYWSADESISLVWCCFKKITRRRGYYDFATEKLIKEIPVTNDYSIFSKFYYKPEPNPAPSQQENRMPENVESVTEDILNETRNYL